MPSNMIHGRRGLAFIFQCFLSAHLMCAFAISWASADCQDGVDEASCVVRPSLGTSKIPGQGGLTTRASPKGILSTVRPSLGTSKIPGQGGLKRHQGQPLVEPIFDTTTVNITVEVNTTAVLPCQVESSRHYRITWTWLNKVLMLRETRMVKDERISVKRRTKLDWNLHIRDVEYMDQGMYRCMIDTFPPKTKTVNLIVLPKEEDEARAELPVFLSDGFIRPGRLFVMNCNAGVVSLPSPFSNVTKILISRHSFNSQYHHIAEYTREGYKFNVTNRNWKFTFTGSAKSPLESSQNMNIKWELKDVSCEDAGSYVCAVESEVSGVSEVSKKFGNLTARDDTKDLRIMLDPDNQGHRYRENDDLAMTCSATGPRDMDLRWYKRQATGAYKEITYGKMSVARPQPVGGDECNARHQEKTLYLQLNLKDDGDTFLCGIETLWDQSQSVNVTLYVDKTTVRPTLGTSKIPGQGELTNRSISREESDPADYLYPAVITLAVVCVVFFIVFGVVVFRRLGTCHQRKRSGVILSKDSEENIQLGNCSATIQRRRSSDKSEASWQNQPYEEVPERRCSEGYETLPDIISAVGASPSAPGSQNEAPSIYNRVRDATPPHKEPELALPSLREVVEGDKEKNVTISDGLPLAKNILSDDRMASDSAGEEGREEKGMHKDPSVYDGRYNRPASGYKTVYYANMEKHKNPERESKILAPHEKTECAESDTVSQEKCLDVEGVRGNKDKLSESEAWHSSGAETIASHKEDGTGNVPNVCEAETIASHKEDGTGNIPNLSEAEMIGSHKEGNTSSIPNLNGEEKIISHNENELKDYDTLGTQEGNATNYANITGVGTVNDAVKYENLEGQGEEGDYLVVRRLSDGHDDYLEILPD